MLKYIYIYTYIYIYIYIYLSIYLFDIHSVLPGAVMNHYLHTLCVKNAWYIYIYTYTVHIHTCTPLQTQHTYIPTYIYTHIYIYICVYLVLLARQIVEPLLIYKICQPFIGQLVSGQPVTASPAPLSDIGRFSSRCGETPCAVTRGGKKQAQILLEKQPFCVVPFAWCPLLCELLSLGKGNKLNKPAHNHIPNISKRVWSSHSKHICRESNGRLYGLLDPLINLLSFVQFLWFCLPLFTAIAIATPIFAGLCQFFIGPDFFVGYIGSKSLLPKFLSHWDRWKAADGSEFHWDMNLALCPFQYLPPAQNLKAKAIQSSTIWLWLT